MTNHTLQKQMIQTGALIAGTGIVMGAFASHELKGEMTETAMNTFQTAVRYQMYHAFAILIMAGMLRRLNEKIARIAFQLFVIGVIVFSGSLYLISTSEITFGDKMLWIGGLTPIGGLLFLGGWAVIAVAGYKKHEGPGEGHRSHRLSDAVREERVSNQ